MRDSDDRRTNGLRPRRDGGGDATRAREGRTSMAIVALLVACSAFFFPRWADWNQNSRLDQVMAIVDRGVLHIDDYHQNTGDYALFEGHYYSDKAPGTAFLGVPVYAAMRAVVPHALVDRLGARLAANPAVLGTLRPDGSGILADKVFAALALYVLTVATVSLPSALSAAAIYRLSGRLLRRPMARVELALAYGLATIAYPYSQAFMGHQIAAACAFGAFALVALADAPEALRRRAPLAGLLLGYALITEYPALFVLAPVGVYALWRLRKDARGVVFLAVAAAAPVLAGAAYNWTIYHTPLPVAYRYSVLFPHHFGPGVMGFTRPTAESLWGLTFSPYRGLFFASPVLLLALPGMMAWARTRRMLPELAVASAGPALLLVFISGMATWAGGNAIGPRHLTTAIPFLMLPIGLLMERGSARARAAFRVLALVSGVSVWVLTVSGQAFPPETAAFPLRDYALPHFLAGDIARNLGTALRLPGWQSLIPVLALVIGGHVWLRRLGMTKRSEMNYISSFRGIPPTPAARRAAAGRIAADLRLLGLTTVLVLLVSSLPPAIALLSEPPDRRFSGIVYNVHDAAQYLSWMREARHGFLADNRLTSEPNPAVFVNLHWWLAGRAGGLMGLSLGTTYEAFRLVSVPLLLVALYAWAALLFPPGARRRTCYLLSVLSSGFGWVLVVLKQFTGELIYPHDVYLMMGNSLFTMVASPHLTFGAALTALTLYAGYRAAERDAVGGALGAGLLALFLGMGHIYDLVTVWGAMAGYAVLRVLRDGWRWRGVASAALVVAVSAPAALYWSWVSSSANPTWQQALTQYDNLGVFTPDPFHLLVLLGLPLMLALATYTGFVPLALREARPLFARTWLAVTLLAVYLPLRFQAMLLTGIQVPLAALATWGLYDHVVPWLRNRLTRRSLAEGLTRWAPVLLILAVLPTNLYLLAWRVVDLSRHTYPYYLHQDDLAAMAWLEAEAAPDAVVLSSFTIGHYLPGLTGRRAYLSNAVMTLDFGRKRALVETFFDPETPDTQRRDMMRAEGVRYLFFGPAEEAEAGYDPDESALFRVVHDAGRTRIYALR